MGFTWFLREGWERACVCVCVARVCALACLNFLLRYTFSQASALGVGFIPGTTPSPSPAAAGSLHRSSSLLPAPIGDREADCLPGSFPDVRLPKIPAPRNQYRE